ncbi:alpha-L-arabinofuranosidase [Streptomyces ambofaciens]
MSRTRWRLGLGVTALLTASALLPSPAHAEAVADYTITVDPSAQGPAIDDTMYGVFYEDINRAADGGLYAELVQNRSFEYSTADNASYTPLTAWAADGTAEVVNDGGRLNERNRNYLSLAAGSTVTNAGYNTGIRVEKGERYDFSIWSRAGSGTTLTVALRDAAGTLAKVREVAAEGKWRKYTATFTATRTSNRGRLAVTTTGPAALDMVSLFPRDTYRHQSNGLRKDLAEKIEALRPGFLRFPGGCLVNTGSMADYSADSGWQRTRSYQWKDTIGPVEERATNANFWGYNQSYGLGYYEYFRFAEDIGAMPLPVVPALVTGCGQNQAVDDEALLKRHIQDTLDLIEFANGPRTSEWGAKRAAMGHPKPFHLTHLEVGNEENLPKEFFARFERFRAAIEAKYPDITVVSNSGPDDSGATFDTAWQLNREAGVAMVDEHYYNSPQWFLQNNDRYDSYDRSGPKVFLGEYASQGNAWKNALSEAAFMTGLERNADIVKLASYAPLLANEDYVQWSPDLIWFNNHASWNSGQLRGPETLHEQHRRPRRPLEGDRHACRQRPHHRRRRPVDLGDQRGVRRREGDLGRREDAPVRRLLRRRLAMDPLGRRQLDRPGRPVRPDGPGRREHPGHGGRSGLARLRPAREGHEEVREGGLPGRLRRQGHRHLLLVEPGRLEQHPVRGRAGL